MCYTQNHSNVTYLLISDKSYYTEFHLPATSLSLKIDPLPYNPNIEASTSKYRCQMHTTEF